MIARRAPFRASLLTLIAVASLGLVVFGIVAMHAQLAGASAAGSHEMAAMPLAAGENAAADQAAHPGSTGMPSQGGMGGMQAMDCLLLGLACVFGVAGLLILVLLADGLTSLLRRRLLAVRLAEVARARAPEPPSLLVLSISRT